MRPSLLLIFLVPFAAQAETIQLKTGGHINLSAFDCTPVTESQLLHRVCYNEAHHYLIAQIGSEYYDNCNVSPKAVDGLMDSSHVVSDYNQHIRAGHECNSDLRRRIGVAILGALEHKEITVFRVVPVDCTMSALRYEADFSSGRQVRDVRSGFWRN